MKGKIGRKAVAAIVIIIAIALVFTGLLFYLGLLAAPEEPVRLVNVQGDVQVGNSPYQPASEGMALKQGSKIMTGPGGSADMVLFSGSTVRLDEKTQMKINELRTDKGNRTVKLEESAGRAWNKVLKVSGINDYEIRTPTAVATIRGTGFWIGFFNETNISTIGVANGTVRFSTPQAETVVNQDEQVSADPAALGVLAKKALVRDDWVTKNTAKDQQFIDQTREKIKKRYKAIIDIAKSQYGVTDEQIDEYINAYLGGQYTEEQLQAVKKQFGIDIDLTF
jgi:hypothetical protein